MTRMTRMTRMRRMTRMTRMMMTFIASALDDAVDGDKEGKSGSKPPRMKCTLW